MYIRRNPYRNSPPPGWASMATAPRDGSVIEVQNNCGVAASFDLYRWCAERNKFIKQPERENGYGSFDEKDSGFSWRATSQSPATYVDPTGGAQHSNDYWIRAAGLNPRHYPSGGKMFDDTPITPAVRERIEELTPTPAPMPFYIAYKANKADIMRREQERDGPGSPDDSLPFFAVCVGLAILLIITVSIALAPIR